MRPFTKEELEMLSEYEDRFKTAIDSRFVRNLEPRYLTKIKAVYDDAHGGSYALNATCSHCVVNFMTLVGNKYFKDKADYEARAAQLVEALDQVFDEVPDELEPKPASKPRTGKTTNKATNKK